MTDETTLEDLEALVMASPASRWAYLENGVRRRFRGGLADGAMSAEAAMGLATHHKGRHIVRALGGESGGALPLGTLIAVADAFGYDLDVVLTKRES